MALARAAPPHVERGDGLEVVPTLVARVPPEHVPCVYHSHAIYQMNAEWRAAFERRIGEIGSQRDLAHVALEWLGDDPGPRLHLTGWTRGKSSRRLLANCHHHGRWMEWLDGSQ